jgi:hypothetical protein
MAKPTHTLFHVIEGKDGKENFWLKIGAGWEHKDGDGISLDFEVFPTKTGRVTLRRMKDDEGEEEGPRPDGRGLSHLRQCPSRQQRASAGRCVCRVYLGGEDGPLARTLFSQQVEAKIGCNMLNRMTSFGMPATMKIG